MNSIFPIWKPAGITSYDVIRKLKTVYKGVKIGHCGTLDPFAEGVLVICTGKMTKSISGIVDCEKEYIFNMKFGKETDTLDCTGNVIRQKNTEIDINFFTEIIKTFKGEVEQRPPYFSALKINGIRFYEFARKDIFINLKPRKIYILDIKDLSFSKDEAEVYVKCTKGTYIRSLARDISYKLNTCAYIDKLKRISVGEYNKVLSKNLVDIVNG